MSEFYDGCLEIGSEVNELRRDIKCELDCIDATLVQMPTVRTEFAGRLFTMLLMQNPQRLSLNTADVDDQLNLIAAAAWRLADLLDAADPHAAYRRTAGTDDDDDLFDLNDPALEKPVDLDQADGGTK